MKITLSKSQWEKIGQKAGWIKESQFGPNAYEHYTTPAANANAPKVTSNIIVDGKPLVLQGMFGSDSVVVAVYHNGKMIGTYDAKDGFGVIRTNDIEKYEPLKEQIDQIAPQVERDFGKWYHETQRLGKKDGWIKEAQHEGTFGPQVKEVTGDNYNNFINAMHEWRSKFIRAAMELKDLNPEKGTIDYRRMEWARKTATNIDLAMNPYRHETMLEF